LIRISPAAYNEAGISYLLNQQGRAGEYFSKAFQLPGTCPERERAGSTANYYQNVTGDLDKAIQVFLQEIESYPRTTEAYINLGIAYASQGQA